MSADAMEESRRDWPAAPKARGYFQVGTVKTTFAIESAVAREEFREKQAIQIADILELPLLSSTLKMCDEAEFVAEGAHPGSREEEASPGRAGRLLNLMLSRSAVLRWLEDATGCGPLRAVEGKVAQTLHRPGDELRWHDDFVSTEGRALAIVIQLGAAPYEGGEFQLRYKRGEHIFSQTGATAGTAMIFRVDHKLEHRVRPLTAGGPRRVFAGWALRKEAE